MNRLAYLVAGLLATGLAIADAATNHAGWLQLIVFAIAPDLSLLVGISGGLARGQIHPRAVPIYNAVHRYWAPGFLVVIGLLLRSPDWLAAGLAWIAHISFDRSLGFGLRDRDGFIRR